MSGDSFQQRVALLRASWTENDANQNLAGIHDFDSQLDLLLTLHNWTESATRDIAAVYGEALAISVSPAPAAATANPGFSVTIGESYTVTFALTKRRAHGRRPLVRRRVRRFGRAGRLHHTRGPGTEERPMDPARGVRTSSSPCSGRTNARIRKGAGPEAWEADSAPGGLSRDRATREGVAHLGEVGDPPERLAETGSCSAYPRRRRPRITPCGGGDRAGRGGRLRAC